MILRVSDTYYQTGVYVDGDQLAYIYRDEHGTEIVKFKRSAVSLEELRQIVEQAERIYGS